VNNLGFNIYRERNGRRTKLNFSLLAGSALIGGANTVFAAGNSHTWIDETEEGGTELSYWVEEVDLNGRRTW